MEQAKKSMKGDSYCSFCARIKRGLMYQVARREGYNVLALDSTPNYCSTMLVFSIIKPQQTKTKRVLWLLQNK
jgi:hypothetical protein